MKKQDTAKLAGFSLIELVIAVAIVGILASVALPSYLEQVRKSKRTEAFDALLTCSSEQNRYYSASSPPGYFDEATAKGSSLSACGWDGTNFSTSGEHYQLAITNTGCTGGTSLWCYQLTATAVGSQANDTDCRTLVIDHRGVKSATDASNADSTSKCWKD